MLAPVQFGLIRGIPIHPGQVQAPELLDSGLRQLQGLEPQATIGLPTLSTIADYFFREPGVAVIGLEDTGKGFAGFYQGRNQREETTVLELLEKLLTPEAFQQVKPTNHQPVTKENPLPAAVQDLVIAQVRTPGTILAIA